MANDRSTNNWPIRVQRALRLWNGRPRQPQGQSQTLKMPRIADVVARTGREAEAE